MRAITKLTIMPALLILYAREKLEWSSITLKSENKLGLSKSIAVFIHVVKTETRVKLVDTSIVRPAIERLDPQSCLEK